MLNNSIWNHLIMCKQMSFNSLKYKVTNKIFAYKP